MDEFHYFVKDMLAFAWVLVERSPERTLDKGTEYLLSRPKILSLTSSIAKVKANQITVLPLSRFEGPGVIEAEQFPLAIRLLWVCGCVVVISES